MIRRRDAYRKYTRLAHLLTVARFTVLTLRAMDEGGTFSVKTVETTGLFIDESIVLGDKLPSDLGRNHILVKTGRVSG
jgi:hypothetical protein